MAKQVILLGKGSLAIRIAEWFDACTEYDLISIVPVIPEPEWTASLSDWARSARIPVVGSGDFRDIPGADRDDWSVDLIFSVFYDRIFPARFLDKCAMALNLHNGPLPRYRGVSPINWALKNGETSHGTTIHQMTPRIDDGPIVAQTTFSIYPDIDEVVDVYERSLQFGWVLFKETMPRIDRIEPTRQDEADALYYDSAQDSRLGDRRFFTRAESRGFAAANELASR